MDEAPLNGVGHTTSSDQVTPSTSARLKPETKERSPEKRTGTKEVVFDVGDSRRSSNSNYVPNESDLEDDEEDSVKGLDLLDDTSRIPRYKTHALSLVRF